MGKQTVVVIPGSDWQIPIIRKIKSAGLRALVVNPYDDSPAFPYADGHLQSDIFDRDAVITYCKAEKADAIISDQCDIAMPALAEYGNVLGLSTLSVADAHLFTNKYAMREFCIKQGLPSPEYKICYSADEAVAFFSKMNKKAIIKPLDNNSSRGVSIVESAEDVIEHFDEALNYARVNKAVLCERYINGVEFSVDGLKTPVKHFSLAISQKRHFEHNKNIASQLYFTHYNRNFNYDLLRQTNDALIDASDLQFGLTHAEYKYENGMFYLIEVAARGGGNLISSDIVPYLSGIDNYAYLIDCSLGKITAPDFTALPEYRERCAVLKFFEGPKNGGVVERIHGLEPFKNHPSIVALKFNFSAGDTIENAKSDAARIGFYIACCENKLELDALMEQIEERIYIVYK